MAVKEIRKCEKRGNFCQSESETSSTNQSEALKLKGNSIRPFVSSFLRAFSKSALLGLDLGLVKDI
jgi:hypothetical protein